MKRISSVTVLACLVAGSGVCVAQASGFGGSWKMDVSSIKFEGPRFHITENPDGFSTKFGSEEAIKMVCDGKPQTPAAAEMAPAGAMYTCTKTATGYHEESMRGGHTTRKTDYSLSADGATATRKSEIFPKDGKPYTMTTTAKRMGGGKGMTSEWQMLNTEESQDTGVLKIAVTGEMVSFQESDAPKPVECKLDGTELKIGETSTISVKQTAPNTLLVTYRSQGKVARENTFVLGADGASIEETDLTPEPMVSKTTMMFHKM